MKGGSNPVRIILVIVVGVGIIVSFLSSIKCMMLSKHYEEIAKEEKIRNPIKSKEYEKKASKFLRLSVGLWATLILIVCIGPIICAMLWDSY